MYDEDYGRDLDMSCPDKDLDKDPEYIECEECGRPVYNVVTQYRLSRSIVCQACWYATLEPDDLTPDSPETHSDGI